MAQREWRDSHNEVRLFVRTRHWPDFVALGVDEVRRAGGEHLQVLRRLRALLLDVADVAPTDRRPPLQRRLELIDAMLARLDAPDDREIGGQADQQGLGGPLRGGRSESASEPPPR